MLYPLTFIDPVVGSQGLQSGRKVNAPKNYLLSSKLLWTFLTPAPNVCKHLSILSSLLAFSSGIYLSKLSCNSPSGNPSTTAVTVQSSERTPTSL